MQKLILWVFLYILICPLKIVSAAEFKNPHSIAQVDLIKAIAPDPQAKADIYLLLLLVKDKLEQFDEMSSFDTKGVGDGSCQNAAICVIDALRKPSLKDEIQYILGKTIPKILDVLNTDKQKLSLLVSRAVVEVILPFIGDCSLWPQKPTFDRLIKDNVYGKASPLPDWHQKVAGLQNKLHMPHVKERLSQQDSLEERIQVLIKINRNTHAELEVGRISDLIETFEVDLLAREGLFVKLRVFEFFEALRGEKFITMVPGVDERPTFAVYYKVKDGRLVLTTAPDEGIPMVVIDCISTNAHKNKAEYRTATLRHYKDVEICANEQGEQYIYVQNSDPEAATHEHMCTRIIFKQSIHSALMEQIFQSRSILKPFSLLKAAVAKHNPYSNQISYSEVTHFSGENNELHELMQEKSKIQVAKGAPDSRKIRSEFKQRLYDKLNQPTEKEKAQQIPFIGEREADVCLFNVLHVFVARSKGSAEEEKSLGFQGHLDAKLKPLQDKFAAMNSVFHGFTQEFNLKVAPTESTVWTRDEPLWYRMLSQDPLQRSMEKSVFDFAHHSFEREEIPLLAALKAAGEDGEKEYLDQYQKIVQSLLQMAILVGNTSAVEILARYKLLPVSQESHVIRKKDYLEQGLPKEEWSYYLVENGCVPQENVDEYEYSPLIAAIKRADLDMVQVLIESGYSPIHLTPIQVGESIQWVSALGVALGLSAFFENPEAINIFESDSFGSGVVAPTLNFENRCKVGTVIVEKLFPIFKDGLKEKYTNAFDYRILEDPREAQIYRKILDLLVSYLHDFRVLPVFKPQFAALTCNGSRSYGGDRALQMQVIFEKGEESDISAGNNPGYIVEIANVDPAFGEGVCTLQLDRYKIEGLVTGCKNH